MEDPNGTNQSWEVMNDLRDITDDGNRAAERNVSFDSFFPPKDPRSKWGKRLYIAEFLDTVERLPERGFLYHVVALSTSELSKLPKQIDVYPARKVDADKWCELFWRQQFSPRDAAGESPLKSITLP